MRRSLRFLAVLGVLLLASSAQGQTSGSTYPSGANVYLGPYSVYGPGLTFRPPPFYYGPYSRLSVATSVRVPDGSEVLAARYSKASEGSNSFGAPGIGKVPLLSRGFRNTGTGRNLSNSSLSVRVRVIRMREEEERQTGVKSR
jgi:hypothetical protein